MHAYEIRGSFGLENLAPVERPSQEVGPGQVRLALSAVSLNYRDLMTVEGSYNPRQKLPLIPCSDGAGTVVEVGAGVARFKAGDRALPIFAQRYIAGEPTRERVRSTLGGPLDGTLASEIVLSEEGLVATPPSLSDEEAATLACAGLTAWSALITEGGIKAGDTVLVQGTGGVSIFALQFARLAGARVIVTSSSDEKLERARALGAWETINYRGTQNWGARAKELTGGRGVDLIVEVGGAGTLAQSLAAIRFGGTIALIGVLAGGAAEVSIIPVFMQKVRIQGILVGDRDAFEAMNRAIELQGLKPLLDRTFPWSETKSAFEYLAAGRHFGKVVVATS